MEIKCEKKKNVVDVLLGLCSNNNKFSKRIYVADLLKTFRFWDADENEYEIFPQDNIESAQISVILAGKTS